MKRDTAATLPSDDDEGPFCGPVPCQWSPAAELPTYYGGYRLAYDDPQLENNPLFPRPVAWCDLPPWPDFIPGDWPDEPETHV